MNNWKLTSKTMNYFVEYIFGKYAAKLYLCTQIQDNDEIFMYI